jgi:outer membrane protein OmpA-like peptidoglycan-associated protein
MVIVVLLRCQEVSDAMKRNQILTAAAILIFPVTAIWGQSSKLEGNTSEDISDRALDYVSQAREAAESKTPPPPAVQRQSRKEILDCLSRILTTRDTPRGVVVTLRPSEFDAGNLRMDSAEKVAQVAAMVVAHPGVTAIVEGYTDSANGEIAQAHAVAVRAKLIDTGVDPGAAQAVGYIKAKLGAYASDNGRVEILLAGPGIGTTAPSIPKTLTSSLPIN